MLKSLKLSDSLASHFAILKELTHVKVIERIIDICWFLLEGHRCLQTAEGVVCEDPRNATIKAQPEDSLKTSNFGDYSAYPDDYYYEQKEDQEITVQGFTSFQLGVSIALSVMGTLLAIGAIYAVVQYRR